VREGEREKRKRDSAPGYLLSRAEFAGRGEGEEISRSSRLGEREGEEEGEKGCSPFPSLIIYSTIDGGGKKKPRGEAWPSRGKRKKEKEIVASCTLRTLSNPARALH